MQLRSFLGHNSQGFHRVAYAEWGYMTVQPPVICVHGLIRNGRDFDRLAQELESSRRILCPDIVGRGKSDRLADPSGYNYAQYIQDMTALIARAGSAEIDWVGTSMGGIMGIYMAAAANSPIRRLVINDVGPFIPLAALKRIASYVSAPPTFTSAGEGAAYLRKIYAGFGITREEDWQHIAECSLQTDAEGLWRLAYDPAISANFANLDKDVDFWDVYDRIRCPVLLLRGEISDILSAQVAQEMTTRGPKAKLVTIKNTGHAPSLMDSSQIQILKEFLN